MHDSVAIPFAGGVVKVVRHEDLRDSPAWKCAFQMSCKDHRYYELIEQTLANEFEYRYAVIEDGSGKVKAVQSIFFVQQNLVEGMRGGLRKIVDFVRRKFPRFLTMRVLMVGCAAGAGELDARNPDDEKFIVQALGATLRSYARKNKSSLVVFKDFLAKYRPSLGLLRDHRYTRVPSMPMTRLTLSFQNFEEYLQTL